MRSNVSATLLLLLSFSQRVVSSPRQDAQVVIAPPSSNNNDNDNKATADIYAEAHADHVVEDSIRAALNTHSDPVDALVSLQPELAAQLAEPRLIHVLGQPKPEWMTEGDKLRLRRQRKKFMDITDHEDLYTKSDNVDAWAGKASTETSSLAASSRCQC